MNTAVEYANEYLGRFPKPISPKLHALIDYALVASLLALPSIMKMKKSVKLIYAAEAFLLLPYIGITKQPLAFKGLIPFRTHGKLDPFNIGQFAVQSLFKVFRKNKKELLFNIAFTGIAGLTVLFTDWKGDTSK